MNKYNYEMETPDGTKYDIESDYELTEADFKDIFSKIEAPTSAIKSSSNTIVSSPNTIISSPNPIDITKPITLEDININQKEEKKPEISFSNETTSEGAETTVNVKAPVPEPEENYNIPIPFEKQIEALRAEREYLLNENKNIENKLNENKKEPLFSPKRLTTDQKGDLILEETDNKERIKEIEEKLKKEYKVPITAEQEEQIRESTQYLIGKTPRQELSDIKNKIDTAMTKVKELKSPEINILQEKLKSIDKELNKYQNYIDKINKKRTEIENLKNKIQENQYFNEYTKEQDINKLNQKIQEYNSKINTINTIKKRRSQVHSPPKGRVHSSCYFSV